MFTLLALSLPACVETAALPGANCEEGICIKLQVAEPVRSNEPVTVTITVTTQKDIPRLGVFLHYDPNVVVDGPQGWESYTKDGAVWKSGASWEVGAKANLPLLFTRTLRFPQREGLFQIVARATTPTPGPLPSDSVTIHFTRTGGTIYPLGTTIPIIPTLPPTPTLLPYPPPTLAPTPRPLPPPTRAPTPTRAPYP